MEPTPGSPSPGISKVKLAVGAASLFLFIVGVKRTFRMDEAADGPRISEEEEGDGAGRSRVRAVRRP